jgi:hypothetical protein
VNKTFFISLYLGVRFELVALMYLLWHEFSKSFL